MTNHKSFNEPISTCNCFYSTNAYRWMMKQQKCADNHQLWPLYRFQLFSENFLTFLEHFFTRQTSEISIFVLTTVNVTGLASHCFHLFRQEERRPLILSSVYIRKKNYFIHSWFIVQLRNIRRSDVNRLKSISVFLIVKLMMSSCLNWQNNKDVHFVNKITRLHQAWAHEWW